MQDSVELHSTSGLNSTATTNPHAQQPAQPQADHLPETLPPLLQRSSHAVQNPQLLAYERNLLDELIGQDALVILATGLGWQKLVAVFIRLHQHQQPGAVLILGCQPWQRTLINKELTRHHNAGPGLQRGDLVLPIEVNSEVPAAERVGHYRSNACCYVTTRILVVDMLSGRVAPGQIAGMLVVNAHKVRAECGVQGAGCDRLAGLRGVWLLEVWGKMSVQNAVVIKKWDGGRARIQDALARQGTQSRGV